MKKIFALLLALIMMLSLCSCSDLMDGLSQLGDVMNNGDDNDSDGEGTGDGEDEEIEGEFIGLYYALNDDGETCTVTGCENATGESFVLPARIDGYRVVAVGEAAFADMRGIKKLVIPEGVTSIGDRAFKGAGIRELTLPDSLRYIGVDAFKNTVYYNNEDNWSDGVLYAGAHLLAVEGDMPEEYKVKSGTVAIAAYAFADRDTLAEITLPVSLLAVGEGAFEGCDGITKVTLPGKLEYLGARAFADCFSLTELVIPASARYVGACILVGCPNLYELNCKASESDMAGWDESWNRGEDSDPDSPDPVRPSHSDEKQESADGGNTDNGTDSDKNDTSDDTNADGGFDDGIGLPDDETNSTEKPDDDKNNTQVPGGSVGGGDFNYDDELIENLFVLEETYYFPEFGNIDDEIEGYRIMGLKSGYAMYDEYLKELHIPSYYRGKPIITVGSGKDPKYENNPSRIGFYNNLKIEKVYIPSTVLFISPYAFMNCTKLEQIVFDENCQTELGFRAFSGCEALKTQTVRIPSGVTADRFAQVFYESWVKSFSFGKDVSSDTVYGVCMMYEEHIYFDGTAEECLDALQNYCTSMREQGNDGTVHCKDGDYTFGEIRWLSK